MAEYNVPEAEGIDGSYPVYRATKIEMGNLCSLNSTGYLIESTDTASTQCIGIAQKTVDNTSGSDGDLNCPVRSHRRFRIKNSATVNALTTAMGRCLAYVETSEKVVATAGSTNKIVVGVVDGDVTADYVWVWVTAPGLYATSAPVDLTVGQDLTVTRDLSVGRNVVITGTSKTTGVATFDAKSVHSLGITITAGGETITAGNLLVTAGNITSTLGNIVATKGNVSLAEGDLQLVDGGGATQTITAQTTADTVTFSAVGSCNLTVAKGAITATVGNIVATKGDVVITEGALTMTKGSATLTAGDLTLTKGNLTVTAGIIKTSGVLATDGIQVGYAAAAITEPPKIAELTAAFGAPAAGRNGFLGQVYNTGGASKRYLAGINNAVWSAVELTVSGA